MKNPYILTRKCCPACDSTNFRIVFSLGYGTTEMKTLLEVAYTGNLPAGIFDDTSYELGQCRKCNLFFQTNILNPEGMQLMYDRWIDPQRAHEWQLDGFDRATRSYTARIEYVKRHFGRPTLRCLDYGAGFGVFAKLARQLGMEVSVFELSRHRQSFMTENSLANISLDNAHAHSFDFINIDQVIEHLAEPLDALLQAKKLLSKDGIIYLGMPNAPDIMRSIRFLDLSNAHEAALRLRKASPLQHINCFARRPLQHLINRAGFKIKFSPIREALCARYDSLSGGLRDLARPFYHYFTTSVFISSRAGAVGQNEKGGRH